MMHTERQWRDFYRAEMHALGQCDGEAAVGDQKALGGPWRHPEVYRAALQHLTPREALEAWCEGAEVQLVEARGETIETQPAGRWRVPVRLRPAEGLARIDRGTLEEVATWAFFAILLAATFLV